MAIFAQLPLGYDLPKHNRAAAQHSPCYAKNSKTLPPIICVKVRGSSLYAELLTTVIMCGYCRALEWLAFHCLVFGHDGKRRMRRLSTIVTHLQRCIPSFSGLSGKHMILVFSYSLTQKPTVSIAPPPPSSPALLFFIHLSFPLSLGLSTRWVTGLPVSGAKCLVLCF